MASYWLRGEAIDNLTRVVKKAVDCTATQRPPPGYGSSTCYGSAGSHWCRRKYPGRRYRNNVAGFGSLFTRSQGCRTTHHRITVTPSTDDVDAIHTGAGACPLSHVVTATDSAIVRGVTRHHVHRPLHNNRQGYRPAAPIQRFNYKMMPRNWRMTSCTITKRWSNYWAPDLTLNPGFLRPDCDSTAGWDATTRTQMHTLMLWPNYAEWDTRKTHRSCVRNSSANNLSGV